ncbi:MAG: hypothetical protein ACPGXZ_16150 [Saprospiraceae bacterium]
MKTKLFSLPNSYKLLFVGIALSILVAEYFMMQTTVFTERTNTLSLAITLDLVIGIPVLYYFLIIKKTEIPLASILVLYLGMVTLTGFLMPNNPYIHWFEWSLILTEGLLIGIVVFNFRKIIRIYRAESPKKADFIVNLETAFTAVLGKASGFLTGEIAIMRYCFYWKAPIEAFEEHQIFTMHKKSGAVAIYVAFIMATLVEATAVHVLLNEWKPTLAVVLLILSIYSLLYLVGAAVAITKRPILIEGNKIIFRVGVFYYLELDKTQIEKIEPIKKIDETDKTILNTAAFLMTSPNFLLHFDAPVTVKGIYGIKKTTQKMAVFVDDKIAFEKAITL